jgi:catechol 2,3-dioxygenase-like lactoylglutathione lyase family enzyme
LALRAALPLRVHTLDHLVLTVTDVEATVAFYERLGMRRDTFGEGRIALQFGTQKLNLHLSGAEIAPHASQPTPGSADVCFLIEGRLDDVLKELDAAGIPIESGPSSAPALRVRSARYTCATRMATLVELSEPGGA